MCSLACTSLSNINQSQKKKTHHDHELYKYTGTGTKATLNVDNIIKLIKTF